MSVKDKTSKIPTGVCVTLIDNQRRSGHTVRRRGPSVASGAALSGRQSDAVCTTIRSQQRRTTVGARVQQHETKNHRNVSRSLCLKVE